ncbi:MAG: DUF2877 domain-containing protein [Anaerolineales bacterium]|jgi:hypothetical protein
MLSINALSLAPDAKAWLVNTRYPRILHVFDPACNLINEHREVFSIVGPQIGNGPFNIVLDEDICFSKYLRLESPVTLSHTHLYLGDLAINTADANLWNPWPDWERLHARQDDILNQLMSLRACKAKQSPVKLGIASPQGTLLSSAFTKADISSAKTIASQLAGLGIGLTPAGDDYLIGAIYALRIIQPPVVAKDLAMKITNTAAPLTTSLSAAWLKSAGKGQAGILWHEFFNALLTDENIESPVTKLLSVGETSGADALAGFLAVFSAYKERIIDQCPS